MATLNKTNNKRYKQHGKAKEIYDLYNTETWRKLRLGYLMEHPLCEECLKTDKLSPAKEVHHVTPISTAFDKLGMMELAYDPQNLMSLCSECHTKKHHKKDEKKPLVDINNFTIGG